MKTIRTIATVLLAAFMVLGPLAASAAGATMTLTTDKPTYTGTAAITISGTITPAPSITSNVVLTTSGPMGAVDINSVPVSISTGAFTYTFTAGGSAGWTSGTYTVNGTWGASGNSATKTTTFIYSAVGSGGPNSVITVTITTTSISTTTIGVQTTTVTTTVPSSDAAALASMQTSLTAIQSSLSGLTSAVNTISSGITALQSSITSSTSGFGALAGVPAQITSVTNAVNNDQTYVLVVAALAAITLVLELAILVRKLS